MIKGVVHEINGDDVICHMESGRPVQILSRSWLPDNVKVGDPIEVYVHITECDDEELHVTFRIKRPDLSDVTLDVVSYSENEQLVFSEPLTIPVTYESGILSLLVDELGISVNEYTRDELEESLHDQVVFLWNEYAEADDDTLTDSAKELKRELLQAIRKESNNL